jgi:hypothetical protein
MSRGSHPKKPEPEQDAKKWAPVFRIDPALTFGGETDSDFKWDHLVIPFEIIRLSRRVRKSGHRFFALILLSLLDERPLEIFRWDHFVIPSESSGSGAQRRAKPDFPSIFAASRRGQPD